jgi:hypothetical protein
VRRDLAEAVLGWAYGAACDYPLRRSHPLHFTDPAHLTLIGAAGASHTDVVWTAALLVVGLGYYAGVAGETPAVFRGNVQAAIDGRAAGLGRQVARLEAEVRALVRRAEGGRARLADTALLPPADVADRVMKYERHLHGLLTSTLHELERVQARRGGRAVPPPAVADLGVTVTHVAG